MRWGEATTSVSVTLFVIFSQTSDDAFSVGSYSSDGWFHLGTGFSGTLRSLALRGRLSGPDDNYASRVWLKEYRGGGDYLDNDQLSSYVISNNAPFTGEEAEVKFNNLAIPLNPSRYYRLDIYYDYQNRNVILKGTTATGTASWWSLDTCTTCWLPAWNRTRHDYAFFPFIAMEGEPGR